MLATIVAAGGAGVRFGGDKTFAVVRDRPLLYWTLLRLARVPEVGPVVLVVPPARLDAVRSGHGAALAELGVTEIVGGGETRQDSVRNGLAACSEDADLVLVHDAVRPLFSPAAASAAVAAARRWGAAIVAVPARDTLKRAGAELRVEETVSREGVWHAETPQVVRRELLVRAYSVAEEHGFAATDEASLVEHAGGDVTLVRGGAWNLKVTEPEDLTVVAALLDEGGS